VTSYSKTDLEENKNRIEKQNFTIATGIPGGKPAEKDLWTNQFTSSFHRATFTKNGSIQQLNSTLETDKMRKSSVPFGMNSPRNFNSNE
jgi:hypothetical protein